MPVKRSCTLDLGAQESWWRQEHHSSAKIVPCRKLEQLREKIHRDAPIRVTAVGGLVPLR